MDIRSIYRRYRFQGVVLNIIMKFVELFGFKKFLLLHLMSIDLQHSQSASEWGPKGKGVNLLNYADVERYSVENPVEITPHFLKFAEEMLQDSHYKLFGCEVDGKLASYGWICLDRYPLTDYFFKHKGAFLFKDYTMPEYRGKGLHRNITFARLDYLRKIGYQIAYSSVALYNEASYRGFLKCGMRREGIYAKWGDEKIKMTLKHIFEK